MVRWGGGEVGRWHPSVQVAAEGDALVLGGISQCPSFLSGKGKVAVQAVFKKQLDVFVEEGLDFVLCEVSP